MARQEDYIIPTSRPLSALSRHTESNAGWWVAGLATIVAVVALVLMFAANRASQQELQAAREAGRAEALAEVAGAKTLAQREEALPAPAAAKPAAARRALVRSPRRVVEAAPAPAPAEVAAASAGEAAQNASDTVADPNR